MNYLKNLALALASLVVGFLLCEALVRLTDLDKRAAHERYQAIMERVAAEKKVTLIRTADRIGRDPVFSSKEDLVHPNQEGHKVIAQRLFLRLFEPSRGSAPSGAG